MYTRDPQLCAPFNEAVIEEVLPESIRIELDRAISAGAKQVPAETWPSRCPSARNVTMLPQSEDEWRCALDVAPVGKARKQCCSPWGNHDRHDQNATNGQGLWFYQGRWREGLFLPSECGARRRDQRSPRGRLGRVRGRGRAEGASRRKSAATVYIGRPLSVDFRAAGRRREIASQRGDELIQVRADVSVESVVVLLRCGNAYQAIDWGRVLGSAASSTPVQVKGGSSTRNVNRTGASQTLSDNDCQLSRVTRTVEKRLKTPTRSIR